MTENQHFLWYLNVWNQWRNKHKYIKSDLSYTDLSGTNLIDAENSTGV